MNPIERQSAARHRNQYSVRTLLIAATLLGPTLGWFGPPTYNLIRELLNPPERQTQASPTVNQFNATLKAQMWQLQTRKRQWRSRSGPFQQWRTSAGVSESVELGMQADWWERQQSLNN